jgi:hypothetical protein
MGKTSYPSDIVAKIRTARSLWIPWPAIAQHMNMTVDDCRRAIGLPALRPIPEQTSEPDLFAGVGFLGDEQTGGAA